jgi:hypothetical protein
MPWLRSGTVSCTQNSTTVTGTNTGFAANARVGDAFLGPDGRWYEVANIASDTVLSILPAYLGANVNAGAYALAPMQGYVKDSADALRALVARFGGVLAVLGTDATPAGIRNALDAMARSGDPTVTPVFYSLRAAVGGAVPSTQGAWIGWNEPNGSNMSGGVSFTCNQGGGTGGFSWRTVNKDNTAGGPFMIYNYAGVLSVPAGLQVAGRNVVESGTTSAGTYVRYSDGTQICYLRNFAYGPTGAGAQATGSWNPPAPFVNNAAAVMATLQFAESNDSFTISRLNAAMGSNGVVSVTANFSVSQVYRIGLMAIGRWY